MDNMTGLLARVSFQFDHIPWLVSLTVTDQTPLFLDALASLDFTLVSKSVSESVVVSNLGAQNHVIDLTQI